MAPGLVSKVGRGVGSYLTPSDCGIAKNSRIPSKLSPAQWQLIENNYHESNTSRQRNVGVGEQQIASSSTLSGSTLMILSILLC